MLVHGKTVGQQEVIKGQTKMRDKERQGSIEVEVCSPTISTERGSDLMSPPIQ